MPKDIKKANLNDGATLEETPVQDTPTQDVPHETPVPEETVGDVPVPTPTQQEEMSDEEILNNLQSQSIPEPSYEQTNEFSDASTSTPASTTSSATSSSTTASSKGDDAKKEQVKADKARTAKIAKAMHDNLAVASEAYKTSDEAVLKDMITRHSMVRAYVVENDMKMEFALMQKSLGSHETLTPEEIDRINQTWLNVPSVDSLISQRRGKNNKNVTVPLYDLKMKVTAPSSVTAMYVEQPTGLIENLSRADKIHQEGQIHSSSETIEILQNSKAIRSTTMVMMNKEGVQTYLLSKGNKWMAEHPSLRLGMGKPKKSSDGSITDDMLSKQNEYTEGAPGVYVKQEMVSSKLRKTNCKSAISGENITEQDIAAFKRLAGDTPEAHARGIKYLDENFEITSRLCCSGSPRFYQNVWDGATLHKNYIPINIFADQSLEEFHNSAKKAIAEGELSKKKFTATNFKFNYSIAKSHFKQEPDGKGGTKITKDKEADRTTVKSTGITVISSKFEQLMGKGLTIKAEATASQESPIAACLDSVDAYAMFEKAINNGDMNSTVDCIYTKAGDRVTVGPTNTATSIAFRPTLKQYEEYLIDGNKSASSLDEKVLESTVNTLNSKSLEKYNKDKKNWEAKEKNRGKTYVRSATAYWKDLVQNGHISYVSYKLGDNAYDLNKVDPAVLEALRADGMAEQKTAQQIYQDYLGIKSAGNKTKSNSKSLRFDITHFRSSAKTEEERKSQIYANFFNAFESF